MATRTYPVTWIGNNPAIYDFAGHTAASEPYEHLPRHPMKYKYGRYPIFVSCMLLKSITI